MQSGNKAIAKRRLISAPKRIGVVTGGGDCPGLNAVVRAIVLGAANRGWQVFGLERGFEGILQKDRVHELTTTSVRGILQIGGTILGTTNRGNPFKLTVSENGKPHVLDLSEKFVREFHKWKFDALVVIGGDGTLRIASNLASRGIPVIGVPKTIDNDLAATEITFGFNTAVTTATDAIDKLHATAESHERVMVVEVMGRFTGWIALYSGVAGGADVILLPEVPFRFESIVKKIEDRWRKGRHFAIVVAAEGARPEGGQFFYRKRDKGGAEPRLGGIADYVAVELARRVPYETRSLVLGHLQRGGMPTTSDRLLATRFGAAAVRAVEHGERNCMVAYRSARIVTVPLEKAISEMKTVPLDSDIILSARELAISFGDEIAKTRRVRSKLQ